MSGQVATPLHAIRNPQPAEAQMPAVSAGFFNLQSFELIQRVSKAFAQSDLVPKQYQGNLPNCMIAMDMAQRIGANPLMVMQNLYVVHGTPGWSSKFLIATINVSGRFSALRYEWKGEPGTPEYGCRAWTIEKATGERLDGIWVTWAMVKAEGWSSKNGSKWNSMPDQMFVYRAAAFWQRAYAPELGMGLQTAEELHDVIDMADVQPATGGGYTVTTSDLQQQAAHEQPSAKVPQAADDEPPFDVDKETGEVLQPDAATVSGSAPQFTLEDALGHVRAGDIDLARDIARSLTEHDAQIVEQTIANQQKPDTTSRPRRQRDLADME